METRHDAGEGRRNDTSRLASRSVVADPEMWALVAIVLVLVALMF